MTEQKSIRFYDISYRYLIWKKFGFLPFDLKLYQIAFRHKSKSNSKAENNERLEFLGDSILGSVVAEYIFKYYPEAKEGFLSKIRSRIVNRDSLNEIAFKLDFDSMMDYDRSGKLSWKTAPDMFGNAFEAFIGAIYLDKGYHFAKKYIYKKILHSIVDIEQVIDTEQNYKGRIYEYGQKHERNVVFVIEETIQKRETIYIASVFVDDEILGLGKATKKKKAEQEAAKVAFTKLGLE